MKAFMGCGHTANTTDDKGNPVCVMCFGILPGATTVVNTVPDLTGRRAKCSCGRTVDSSFDLAFFEFTGPGSPDATQRCVCGYYAIAHDPEAVKDRVHPVTVIQDGRCKQTEFTPRGPQEYDRYYCGCRGWD